MLPKGCQVEGCVGLLGRKASSYVLPKGCQVEREGWVVVRGVQVGVPECSCM